MNCLHCGTVLSDEAFYCPNCGVKCRDREKVEKRLWDLLFKQQDYIVQEFFTTVIGIGALFFAYGSVLTVPYVRLAIAFIGLGASIIVWTHSYGSHATASAAEERLKNSDFYASYRAINKWRNQKWYDKYLYHSVTRLITYFSALVALVWGLIIFSNLLALATGYIIPGNDFWGVAVIAVLILFFFLAWRKGAELQKIQRQ